MQEKHNKDILQNMKSTVGSNSIDEFFTFVVNSEAQYKVFINQRCLNLFHSYYHCKYKSNIEKSFISGNALFAYIPEIVSEYTEWGFIPEILIIDDILVYGKAINLFLDSFIYELKEYIRSKEKIEVNSSLESDVLKSIKIVTMFQSDNALLMKYSYYQRLYVSDYKFNICQPSLWHDLMLRIKEINSEGTLSNIGSSLSLYCENFDEKIEDYVDIAVSKQNFIKTEWNKRNNRKVWVRSLKNLNGEYKAFYTVRIIQNLVTDKYIVAPFIIFSDLDKSGIDELFEKIFSKKIYQQLRLNSKLGSLYGDLLCLVLNYNLLLLLNYIDNRIEISDTTLDIDKIMMNFGQDSVYGQAVKELFSYKKAYLSWGEFDIFILNNTIQAQSIMKSSEQGSKRDTKTLVSVLNDIILDEEEEKYISCYKETIRKYVIEEEIKPHCVVDLFKKVEQKAVVYDVQDIVECVAEFLKQLDEGAISFKTRIIAYKCNCIYDIEIIAQLIYAKKYANYLSMLTLMENDYNRNYKIIVKAITQLYEEDLELQKRLIEYVDKLYAVGQYLRDWNINWFNCVEIEEATRKANPNKSQKELLISQMLIDAIRQDNEMQRYKSKFFK